MSSHQYTYIVFGALVSASEWNIFDEKSPEDAQYLKEGHVGEIEAVAAWNNWSDESQVIVGIVKARSGPYNQEINPPKFIHTNEAERVEVLGKICTYFPSVERNDLAIYALTAWN